MESRLTLVATLLVTLACGGAQRSTEKDPSMRETPWTVSYADGAANLYTFSQSAPGAAVAFEYVPVTPERSSTGRYSGGEPAAGSVPAGDPRIDELWRRIAAFEADPTLHTDARAKGTGAFRMTTPTGDRQLIIDAGPALADFDAFVATFRRLERR